MPDTPNAPAGPLLDPQAIYDAIMQEIEPDLVSARIPMLDEKYNGETSEERQIRMEHYDYANELFDEALSGFALNLAQDVRALQSQMQTDMNEPTAELVTVDPPHA